MRCPHCGEPLHTTTLFETMPGGGQRPVRILVHADGHERCPGRDTYAAAGR